MDRLGEMIMLPGPPRIIGEGMFSGLMAIGGRIFTTSPRARHGYPLEDSRGKAIRPGTGDETIERIVTDASRLPIARSGGCAPRR